MRKGTLPERSCAQRQTATHRCALLVRADVDPQHWICGKAGAVLADYKLQALQKLYVAVASPLGTVWTLLQGYK